MGVFGGWQVLLALEGIGEKAPPPPPPSRRDKAR